jgi:hypothetical protein
VDGGLTDNMLEILKKYEDRPIWMLDKGMFKAANYGGSYGMLI